MDFYIVGFPRSGTTLLTNRLNESLLVAIPPETRFYAEFGYKKTLNLKVKQLLKAERMKDVISSETKLKPTDIVKGSSSEILTKLILNWAEEKKIKYDLVGEKSPVHQLFLPKILKNEDAKIIYIIRNPVDTIQSVLNAGWGYTDIRKVASLYRYRYSKIKKAFQNERLLKVRYEDLVSDMENTIISIGSFLKVANREHKCERMKNIAVPVWEKKWKNASTNEVEIKARNQEIDNISMAIMRKICKEEGYELGTINKNIVYAEFVYLIYKVNFEISALIKKLLSNFIDIEVIISNQTKVKITKNE